MFLLSLFILLSTAYCGSIEMEKWSKFKIDFRRKYTNEIEEEQKLRIFLSNLKRIDRLNRQHNPRTYFGINQFADVSRKEFVQQLTRNWPTRRRNVTAHVHNFIKPKNIPASVDWRSKGAVTPIENQGICGSSPYFSAVVSMEGAHQIAGNLLVSLSVQQILDCSDSFGNQDCNGGEMTFTYQYVIAVGGIESAADYPYLNGTVTNCSFSKSKVVAKFSSFVSLPGDENSFTNALSIVPVGTVVNVDEGFQYYTSGIYNSTTCDVSSPNHGIGAVGYGSNSHGDYYILKNTWGTTWGMDGYMLLARNQGNMCGIASDATYVVV